MSDDLDITIDDIKPDIKPTLYDINKSFDIISTDNYTGIVGEEEARMVIFTNFVLGEKPCILKGSRSSGKTNILTVVGAYAKKPIIIASSSEKVYSRMDELNQFSHFFIPEINKVHEKVTEMLKDWGEGATYEYSFLDPSKNAVRVQIKPKPFITSIADENKNVDLLGEELLSRLTVVRTSSSIQQNLAVIEEKLKRAANPRYKKNLSQEEVNKLLHYVKTLPSIKEYGFIYPIGNAIRKAIPPLFTDSRRDTDKYLANTYGITMFHFYERIVKEVDGKKYLVVSPSDVWYNHVIYQNILLESSLKCGRLEQEIITILQNNDTTEKTDAFGNIVKGMSVGEIHTRLLKLSYTPTVDSVKKFCNNLTEIGYLTRNEEVRPNRYSLNPELKRDYKFVINWKDIVDGSIESVRKDFPEFVDEYVKKYCSREALTVVHPFSGEKICILDEGTVKQEKVIVKEPVKEEVKRSQIIKQTTSPNWLKGGVIDTSDDVQNKIESLMSDGFPRTGTNIAEQIECDQELVDTTIKYLIKVGSLYEPKRDLFQKMR